MNIPVPVLFPVSFTETTCARRDTGMRGEERKKKKKNPFVCRNVGENERATCYFSNDPTVKVN